jgi:TatD DNase family protein
MLIDTHCHLNFQAFEEDRDKVVRRSLDGGVWMINVGSQLETSRRAVDLAEKYPRGVYAAVGLHPIHAAGQFLKKLDPEELVAQAETKEFDIKEYKRLALTSQKVVAIGEIGLDYYHRPKASARLSEFKTWQKETLLCQMDLAEELRLPVILHCRSVHDDLIELLRFRTKNSRQRGVIHCFTGTLAQAQQYLAMGFYLGFTGIIFRTIEGIDWSRLISSIPLERILVETDAPYLGRKEGRNEPLLVKEVVQEIARIKELSYQEISEATTKNAQKLFSLSKKDG